MPTHSDDQNDSTPAPSGSRGVYARRVLFVVIVLVCTVVALLYVREAINRDSLAKATRAASAAAAPVTARVARPAGPVILFSNFAGAGQLRYRVAVAPIAAPDGPRMLTPLSCEHVYFAGGHGLCLGEGGGIAPLAEGVTATHAYVFAPDFHITHDIPLGGVPSRVRIAPDGRHGAVTVFVVGHSYADAGFSTATTLIDLETGRRLGNLETFAVWRDGRRFRSIDFNFWGVTFAPDSDRFYATLRTGGRTYLVEGSVATREMHTVRENVECPSASPDGRRLAFKRRVGGADGLGWRFHVLDLATMTDVELPEPRGVDDQIEWLDDRQVLYSDGGTVWVVDADGTGAPRKFLSQATSPAVVRGEGPAAPAGVAATGLTLPVADLAVSLSSSASTLAVGGETTYTITVTNNGPSDASMLKVDQILPAGLMPAGAFTVSNPGQGYGCARHDSGHLSCDTIALPSGRVWTISFAARAVAPGTHDVHVAVSGAEADPNFRNDRAETRVVVGPAG